VYQSPCSVYRDYQPKVGYLNSSTCCSVLPLTCSIHWLRFLERYNTSVFSVLVFIPAWMYATENRSCACWRPCSEDVSSTKSSAKSKWLILQLQQWHPRRFGCDCRSISNRLWRGVVTAYTIVAIQHQRWAVVIYLRRYGRKLLSRNTVTWRPVTGGRQHRTPAPQSFSRGTRSFTFLVSTNICRRFWHTPRISLIYQRVKISSLMLRPGKNSTGYRPAWVQLFRGIFQGTWHTLFQRG